MNYFGYMPNDFINGEGVCVSLWTAGCPHHCEGCQNPEAWDFDSGYTVPTDLRGQIIKAISANGITRNFSILGGEPLCDQNIDFVKDAVSAVRTAYPNIKIFIWTGYLIEELNKKRLINSNLDYIMNNVDIIIDGPFILSKRDITLHLMGSSNQRILEKNLDF